MKIKPFEFCIIFFFITQSFILGIDSANSIRLAGVNCYLSPIIGGIIGFVYLLIILYIFNYKSNLNINELNKKLFGKYGKIINLILILFASFFVLILNWNLLNFVTSQYLYDTPKFYISILFIVAFIYLVNKDRFSISRSFVIFFYIFVVLAIISIVGLIFQVKQYNLLPFLENGLTPVFNSTISNIAYLVLPIFFILIIPKDEVDDHNLTKKIIITYMLSILSAFSILFLTIGVFGIELTNLYQYPIYHVLKRVLAGTFIEKSENLLAIQNILVLFLSITFYLYYIKKSINDNLPKIKNIFFYIFAIILLYFSQYLFKNNSMAENFLLKIFPNILIVFILGITLIIFIKILHKKRSIT